MSTATLIPETKRKFTETPRKLTPEELGELLHKLMEATTTGEKEAIQLQYLEGFYGRRFSSREFEQIQIQEREMFPQYANA